MSAGGYLDGCGFIPASSGTGDFVVSAAVQGYQTPASAGAVNATVYTYRAESADKSQWEIGFGTYTTGTTTLARTTQLATSTGSKVAFSAAPNVFVTAAKADLQNASLLTSGTVATARLGSGTASATTALFGDQTYKSMANIAQSGSASDLSTGTIPAARYGMPVIKAAAYVKVVSGVVTVLNSFNVSSVTRPSAGQLTVNFTTAFADANYFVSALQDSAALSNAWAQGNNGSGASGKTTTAFTFSFLTSTSTVADPPFAYMLFFE